MQVGEIGDSVEFVLVSPTSQLAKEQVIATNPTARKGAKKPAVSTMTEKDKEGRDTVLRHIANTLTVSGVAGYKVLSSEEIDGKTVKTYGAKVWSGQGELESGDVVECLNWKGQGSLQLLDEWLEAVDSDFSKGEMGYEVWSIKPVAKRK